MDALGFTRELKRMCIDAKEAKKIADYAVINNSVTIIDYIINK